MAVWNYISKYKSSSNVKTVGIYTFTGFFAKGVSFLLIPLFTNPKFLSPADNGLLSLFSNSILFLTPFISLGLIQSASTDFFKLNKKDFKDFFTTAFFMSLIMTLLASIVIYFFRNTFVRNYGFPLNFVYIIPLVAFLTFCVEQLNGTIRNNNEPVKYLLAGILKILLELGIAIFLIVYIHYGWKGRIIGVIISLIVVVLFAFKYFRNKNYLFGEVKKRFIREELLYALPIITMQIATFVMSSSDKYFLAGNHETVGIYSTACVFCSIIILFCSALIQYLAPTIYNLLSVAKIDYGKIKKLYFISILLMLLTTVMVILGTSFFYKYFINIKYHSALKYIHFIAIGYLFWSMTAMLNLFLLYHKQKKVILVFFVLCTVISLSSNWYFISNYNAMGAAISVCITYFSAFLLGMFFTRQYWKNFFLKKVADNTAI